VLSNHHFDKTYNAIKRHQDNKSKDQKKDEKEKVEAPEMSFANIEGKSYCCGKVGHKSPACQMKDKFPRDKWAIKRQNLQNNSMLMLNSLQMQQLRQTHHLQQKHKDGVGHKFNINFINLLKVRVLFY
jgi:hypothetical protein